MEIEDELEGGIFKEAGMQNEMKGANTEKYFNEEIIDKIERIE